MLWVNELHRCSPGRPSGSNESRSGGRLRPHSDNPIEVGRAWPPSPSPYQRLQKIPALGPDQRHASGHLPGIEANVTDLQLEYRDLPALRDGRRRHPDVYLELTSGARVAFECQQQTMAGSDPKAHRAKWQTRMGDYRELRKSLGLRVVWLVSPRVTTSKPKFERDNVWRVEVFGGYAAQMLEEGETVYWIDPTFGQVGTLTEHIPRPHDLDLPRGYLKHAREFPRGGKWYWLHSDNIVDCEINPLTGIVTTPTDLRVQQDQGIADRHVELKAEKIAAAKREQAAREERIKQEARERVARDEAAMRERQETARTWRENRNADDEFYRRIKAEADREARRK